MKFAMTTKKLKSILSIIGKGVGKKGILQVTEYIQIVSKGGNLLFTATDGGNFISHVIRDIGGDDGEIIVKADTLIKLVNKTTKDLMQFTAHPDHLAVKGNGNYKVEILDNTEFPTWSISDDAYSTELPTKVLQDAITLNKSAISYELLMPCLRGYLMGPKVITTDAIKMCINDTFISDEQFLLTQTMAELIMLIPDEKVTIQKEGNKLLVQSNQMYVYGAELAGIEKYPDITPLLNTVYDAMCVVPKKELLEALNRLSLFTSEHASNAMRLEFSNSELTMSDLSNRSCESIRLEQHVRAAGEDVTISLNLDYFQELISVIPSETISMHYSENTPLKLEHGPLTQIISIMTGGS